MVSWIALALMLGGYALASFSRGFYPVIVGLLIAFTGAGISIGQFLAEGKWVEVVSVTLVVAAFAGIDFIGNKYRNKTNQKENK